MIFSQPLKLLAFLIASASINLFVGRCQEIVEKKVFQDSLGNEHEEYAFRAPIKGIPNQILRMYCANVRVRLYWDVYREQAKSAYRYGANLRRMARFAKHVYEDVRKIDKPMNATQLSVVDEYFAAKYDANEEDEDEKLDMLGGSQTDASNLTPCKRFKKSRLRQFTKVFSRSKSPTGLCDDQGQQVPSTESLKSGQQEQEVGLDKSKDSLKELESKHMTAAERIKFYLKKYAPKVGVGIYTRWITMWWMMMSCLFAKYYLWDPALDEFIKLQRKLVMYPDIQLIKLTDVNCKPVRFFQRILGVCGILNPMMNIDFGQLSLDKMTKFKSDMAKDMQ